MAGAMLFERAQAVSMTNRSEGINLLNEIVSDPHIGSCEDDEDSIRVKEQGILQLGELYKKEGKAKELADLIKATRPFLSLISKAKAAKLVRSLVDFFLDLEAGIGIEVGLSKKLRFSNSLFTPVALSTDHFLYFPPGSTLQGMYRMGKGGASYLSATESGSKTDRAVLRHRHIRRSLDVGLCLVERTEKTRRQAIVGRGSIT